MEKGAHINVIVQFDPPGAVQIYLFERLSDNIVWLSLRLLSRLDYRSFVNIAIIVNVKFPECVLEAEDVCLLELGIFPNDRLVTWLPRRLRIGNMLQQYF